MATSKKVLNGKLDELIAARDAKESYDKWHPNVILSEISKGRTRQVDVSYARNPRADECRTFTIEQELGGERFAFSPNFVTTIDKFWRTTAHERNAGIRDYYYDTEDEAWEFEYNNYCDEFLCTINAMVEGLIKEEKGVQAMSDTRRRRTKQTVHTSTTQPEQPTMQEHRDAIPPPPPETTPEPITEQRPAAFDPFEATENNTEPRRAIPPPPIEKVSAPEDDGPKCNEILASVLLNPIEPETLVEAPKPLPPSVMKRAKPEADRPPPHPAPEPLNVEKVESNKTMLYFTLAIIGAFAGVVIFVNLYEKMHPAVQPVPSAPIVVTTVEATQPPVAPTPPPAPTAGTRLKMTSGSLERYFGQKDPTHYDQSINSPYSGPSKPRLVCSKDCPENPDGTLDVSQAEILFR